MIPLAFIGWVGVFIVVVIILAIFGLASIFRRGA